MKYVIDRFENEFAVVELSDKSFVNIPRKAIPPDAKEGSVIEVKIDPDETAGRTVSINNKMNNLFQ